MAAADYGMTPKEFAGWVRDEEARWARAGLKRPKRYYWRDGDGKLHWGPYLGIPVPQGIIFRAEVDN